MFSTLPWWLWCVLYALGIAYFGGLHHRIQARRCSDTECDGHECGHMFWAWFGYVLWPIVLPCTVLYELADGTTVSRIRGARAKREAEEGRKERAALDLIKEKNEAIERRNQLLSEQALLETQLKGTRDEKGLPIDS